MTLEMFKFGIVLTIIPFSVIFLFIVVWWALVDLSLREISGSRRIGWTLAVIVLPAVGPILYNYLVRRSTPYRKLAAGEVRSRLCSAVD